MPSSQNKPAPPKKTFRLAALARSRGFRVSLVLFALVWSLFETGWLSSPLSWQESCGWKSAFEHTPPPSLVRTSGPTLTWLGHAGFLVEWHGQRLVLDPNLSPRCKLVKRLFRQHLDPGPLGSVDAALISHSHFDHLDIPTLKAIPHLGNLVAPRGTDRLFSRSFLQKTRFVAMDKGDSVRVGSLTITAVKALHGGARYHPFASRYQALGYVIGDGETNLYFAGDTAYGDFFKDIAKRFHPRIAILPIGAFAPRFC